MGIFFRGLLMGLAEIVPGISGGTVALVTGIYSRLVSSLASFGPRSIGLLRSPRTFYLEHDLGFLLVLFCGMAVGVFSFSTLMNFLLGHYGPIVWGMFSGLILGSVFLITKDRYLTNLLIYGLVGLLVGLSFLYIPQSAIEFSYLLFFLVSMLAVCAWVLPGVSGSFVMLIFGYYQTVLDAIANIRIDVLIVLGLGLISGLMMFTKTLRWILSNYEDQLFSFLAGLMLGSLAKLWPWQVLTAEGLSEIVGPQVFADSVGQSSYILLTLLFFLIGILLIWLSTGIKSRQDY